jgi:hypothetical protein
VNIEDHNLILLIEECGEASIELALGRVVQRASKQLRFGADEVQRGQDKTNRERLRYELLDLLACIRFLESSGQIDPISAADVEAHQGVKQARIDRMLQISRDQGRIE